MVNSGGGMTSRDRATQVRPGEELDTRRLVPFLVEAIPDLEGDLEVLQFPSGFSNLTYLLRAGGRELVLRRPPFGSKPKSGHDMNREFTVLSALKGYFPYCPEPLAFTEDESIIGSPFYVMSRLEGIIVRRDFPPGLDLTPEEVGALFDRVVDVHAELHSVDYRAVGLEEFGRPEGYVERQVAGWSRRYRAARTPDVPDGERVMAWLAENRPSDSTRPSLIHNDFRLDNVVLDPADLLRIVGVLDWEMATIGDPLMDLGASLAYWVEAGRPAPAPGLPDDADPPRGRPDPPRGGGALLPDTGDAMWAASTSTTATACSGSPASSSRSTTARITARPRTSGSSGSISRRMAFWPPPSAVIDAA